jgi:prepilin signal peptidase PulO-like enzyme (type II secretory pathway)
MEALAFFVVGLPLAAVANRFVLNLTSFEEDLVVDESGRRLFWQRGAWPGRVRWGVLLMLPLLMAVAGARFDVPQAVAVSLLLAALLMCTATDLLRFRVPNVITYPGTVLALGAALLMPNGDLLDALLAALLGGAVFFFLAIVTSGGIGLGDAKLAVLIGAGLGLPIAYHAMLIGVITAGIVMVLLLVVGLVGRRQSLPYAPFLALGAIAMMLLEGTAFAPL